MNYRCTFCYFFIDLCIRSLSSAFLHVKVQCLILLFQLETYTRDERIWNVFKGESKGKRGIVNIPPPARERRKENGKDEVGSA